MWAKIKTDCFSLFCGTLSLFGGRTVGNILGVQGWLALGLFLSILLGLSSGCVGPGDFTDSTGVVATGSGSSQRASVPAGPKFARFYMKIGNPSGSFSATPAGVRKQSAVRVFNPDGSLMADGGPTASAWPKWITGF